MKKPYYSLNSKREISGIWKFPGGKLEADETPQACIVCELREELGVESVAGKILTTSLYTYPGGAVELIAVVVTLRSTALKLQVHDLAKWIPPHELLCAAYTADTVTKIKHILNSFEPQKA
ncbi:NUDIX domain-containing protein [Pseudomonas aeruginosa]|uniref:NUDIX domain-containing protein n=1 Tax=Pseudomonas aeruginosa TaxID=287 RepID=UPI003CC6D825